MAADGGYQPAVAEMKKPQGPRAASAPITRRAIDHATHFTSCQAESQ
jgi:hypothetical protein